MSKKAALWQAFEGSARVPDSGIDADTLTTQGVYYLTTIAAQASANAAYAAAHIMVVLRMGTRILQLASRYAAPGHISFRTSADGAWLSWAEIATTTTPTVFEAPMAEGWGGWIRYCKTQDGMATVFGQVGKSTPLISRDVMSTLPAGFRPYSPAPIAFASTGGFVMSGYVGNSGAVMFNAAPPATYQLGSNINFSVTYPVLNA